jgi:hypothetical protein
MSPQRKPSKTNTHWRGALQMLHMFPIILQISRLQTHMCSESLTQFGHLKNLIWLENMLAMEICFKMCSMFLGLCTLKYVLRIHMMMKQTEKKPINVPVPWKCPFFERRLQDKII